MHCLDWEKFERNKQMSEVIPQMLVFYMYSKVLLLLMKGQYGFDK